MKVNLPDFKKIKVLVIGDIMLDLYYYGNTNRISPEAPVPIVKIKRKEKKLGGAANVAANIATLGANVSLIGFVGNDKNSIIIEKKLKKFQVSCDLIKIKNYSINVKKRIFSNNQQIIRFDFEKKIKIKNEISILNKLKKKIKYIDILVLSDYKKGSLFEIKKIIKIAKLTKIPVFIDPKGKNFNNYYGATLLTPNISEFENIVGKCSNNIDLEKKGTYLINKLNLQALLITRSENGMTLIEKHKKPIHIPAKAKIIQNVIGAGDTVISVLSCAFAAKLNLFKSSFLANIAAGITIGKKGTSTIYYSELENTILKNTHIKFGIMNEKELIKAIKISQSLGNKIVMINGFFDILKTKHIKYLNNARKLGDKLIVAINSDESIKRLKGKNKPINTLKKRMEVLNALSSVDWIIPFKEDEPKKLINQISPDVVYKKM